MAPSSTPAWTITAQREDFQPGPNGQLTSGVVVSFMTALGATGSVFVPHASYSVDTVRAQIDARAKTMDAVQGLTG